MSSITPPERRQPRLLEWVADALFGSDESAPGRSVFRLLAFVWFMMSVGVASLIVFAVAHFLFGNRAQSFSILGVGLFLMGASTAFGSMLGFLFGVPKASLIQEPDSTRDVRDEPTYLPNTNLETISDWLTKVIVGVGLVEIREVIAWIAGVGQVAGAAMGGGDVMRTIATSMVVHNGLMGFFQGFLVAYLYLPKVFAAARRSVEPSAADRQ